MKDTINLFGKPSNTRSSLLNTFFRFIFMIFIILLLATTFSCRVKVTKLGHNIIRNEPFDAVKTIEDIFESEMIPYFKEKSVDINDLLELAKKDPLEATKKYSHHETAEGTKHNFSVKGTGKVISEDGRTAGWAQIDLPPYDGKYDLEISVGPMLKASLNSLRDAYEGISFGDVTNQQEWGDIGNSIKNKVIDTLLKDMDKAKLVGKIITFYGAFTNQTDNNFDEIQITPIILEIE